MKNIRNERQRRGISEGLLASQAHVDVKVLKEIEKGNYSAVSKAEIYRVRKVVESWGSVH